MMNTKIKAIIAYLVIFTVGLIVGYVIHDVNSVNNRNGRIGATENGERFFQHQTDEGRRLEGQMRSQGNNRLGSLLDLNDEQKDVFFQKLNEFRVGIRSDIRDFRMEENGYIVNRYHEFREDVSDFLSEEQLIRLDRVAHPDSVRQARTRMNKR